jgi:hypothetical protein
MRKIKKFEPLSVMRIAAICYGALGLLEGALISLIFMVAPMGAERTREMSPGMGLLFGGLSIVFFPIFLGVIGAIMSGIGALIYNVSAHYVGGIGVEVE